MTYQNDKSYLEFIVTTDHYHSYKSNLTYTQGKGIIQGRYTRVWNLTAILEFCLPQCIPTLIAELPGVPWLWVTER